VNWKIDMSASADRSLSRLPERYAAAIVEFILGPLRENPHRLGKSLHGDYNGLHSARRAEFRVIYRISQDEGIIHVAYIDLRAHSYRRR
jgi:mRNA-degrading endonuclease RelE of RelBE toxin-antitoxin system